MMTDSEVPVFVLAARDPLTPRAPWSFLVQASAGGFTGQGVSLLAAWAAFFLTTNISWALHLRSLAGWSSLPNYWGELLTARDLWELVENGGLKVHWTGPAVPLAAGLSCLWFLWAGWRVQTGAVGLPARLGPWAWGFLDAVLLGLLPLLLVELFLITTFNWLGSSGIQGLGWLQWVGGAVVRLACVSAFFLQWWLCRLGRASGAPGWRMGGWQALSAHLRRQALALWLHPVEWSVLVVGGVVVRTGLTFLVLALAWRMGGGTSVRVWTFLGLQVAVVLLNAWQLGWFLRLVAFYGQHDAKVQAEIGALEAATRQP
jgi:hypothetical protein